MKPSELSECDNDGRQQILSVQVKFLVFLLSSELLKCCCYDSRSYESDGRIELVDQLGE
jgi:hypothetical protein